MDELLSLLTFVALAAAAALVVRHIKPRATFVVRVRAGRPEAVRGKVTEAFLREVAEACDDFHVRSAEVRGVPRGRRILLWFSGGVPPAARQRLRNWWGWSGWPA